MLGISQMRIQNEQAEKIKEHLEQLVTETFKKSNINTKLGLSRHRLPGSRHRPDDVKKIVGMIRVHSIVDVNHKPHHQLCGSPSGMLTSQEYQDEAQLANGTISINTWRCKDTANQEASFISIVQFRTDESQYQMFRFSVYLSQTYMTGGLMILPPFVVVHTIIPDDSPILNAIRDGKYEKFIWLLQNGQARIWDCDSQGRGLLTYAVFGLVPKMVEYLVLHGLDVNAEELSLQEGFEVCVTPELIIPQGH
ncbi:hypothetical protein D6D01_04422 [Aureobasidium pullulans]|uniref:Uncharacterized protein n=1 Tax=Aureobasidium pullulans TaxID=5580 RepID=A0A4S9LB51_AURPU|nr:hypothetical protein D6D01_04422 [Aureobasidium pullulans]